MKYKIILTIILALSFMQVAEGKYYAPPDVIIKNLCSYSYCSDCTASPYCGWCETTKACQTGSLIGPNSGSCDNWKWGRSTCTETRPACPYTCISDSECSVKGGAFATDYACPYKQIGYSQIKVHQACCNLYGIAKNEMSAAVTEFIIGSYQQNAEDITEEFGGLGMINFLNIVQIIRAESNVRDLNYEIEAYRTILDDLNAGRKVQDTINAYSIFVTGGKINDEGRRFLDDKYSKMERQFEKDWAACVARHASENYNDICREEGAYPYLIYNSYLVGLRQFEEQSMIRLVSSDRLLAALNNYDIKTLSGTNTTDDSVEVIYQLARNLENRQGFEKAVEVYNIITEEFPGSTRFSEAVARKTELQSFGHNAKVFAAGFAIGIVGLDNLMPMPGKTAIMKQLIKIPGIAKIAAKYGDKKTIKWLFKGILSESELETKGKRGLELAEKLDAGTATEAEKRELAGLLKMFPESVIKESMISKGVSREIAERWVRILEDFKRGKAVSEDDRNFFNLPLKDNYVDFFPDSLLTLDGNVGKIVDDANRLLSEGKIEEALVKYKEALDKDYLRGAVIRINMRKALLKKFGLDNPDNIILFGYGEPNGLFYGRELSHNLPDIRWLDPSGRLVIVKIEKKSMPIVDASVTGIEDIRKACGGCDFFLSSNGNVYITNPMNFRDIYKNNAISVDITTFKRAEPVKMNIIRLLSSPFIYPEVAMKFIEDDLGESGIKNLENLLDAGKSYEAWNYIKTKYGVSIEVKDFLESIYRRELEKVENLLVGDPDSIALRAEKTELTKKLGLPFDYKTRAMTVDDENMAKSLAKNGEEATADKFFMKKYGVTFKEWSISGLIDKIGQVIQVAPAEYHEILAKTFDRSNYKAWFNVMEKLGVKGEIVKDADMITLGQGSFKRAYLVRILTDEGSAKFFVVAIPVYTTETPPFIVREGSQTITSYREKILPEEFDNLKALEHLGISPKVYTDKPLVISYSDTVSRQNIDTVILIDELISGKQSVELIREGVSSKDIYRATGELDGRLWQGTVHSENNQLVGLNVWDNHIDNILFYEENGKLIAKYTDLGIVPEYGFPESMVISINNYKEIGRFRNIPIENIKDYLDGIYPYLGDERTAKSLLSEAANNFRSLSDSMKGGLYEIYYRDVASEITTFIAAK